jgi:hypothetical protein
LGMMYPFGDGKPFWRRISCRYVLHSSLYPPFLTPCHPRMSKRAALWTASTKEHIIPMACLSYGVPTARNGSMSHAVARNRGKRARVRWTT